MDALDDKLIECAIRGDKAQAERIMRIGADVNAKEGEVLAAACRHNQQGMVKWLLRQRETLPHIRNFRALSEVKSDEVAKLVFEQNPTEIELDQAMTTACQNGDLIVVQTLCRNGVKFTHKHAIVAAESKHFNVVNWLQLQGVDLPSMVPTEMVSPAVTPHEEAELVESVTPTSDSGFELL